MQKTLFRGKTFRSRLTIAFILCSVLPLALTGYLFYSQSFHIARDNIMKSVRHTSQGILQGLEHRLAQMEQVSDSTQNMLYRLSNSAKFPFTQYIKQFVDTRGNISSLAFSFDMYSVNIFTKDGLFLCMDGIMFLPLDWVENYGLDLAQLQSERNTGLQWMYLQQAPIRRSPLQPGAAVDALSCCRKKVNIYSGELEYVYFVHLEGAVIQALLQNALDDPQITRCLTDSEGRILAHSDGAWEGEALSEEIRASLREPAGDYMALSGETVSVDRVLGADFLLVTRVDNGYIRSSSNRLLYILPISLALVFLAVLLAIAWLSGSMSRKLSLLAHTMRHYKTSNDTKGLSRLQPLTRAEEGRRDEFDELAVSFVDMAARLEDNFNKMIEMRLQKEQLDYQLLQAKINPHFLYNILESIKTCQTHGKIDLANAMITKLAKFYRQQLSRAGELITLAEELETATTYLEIEKLCRPDTLFWDIALDEGIENFQICRFSLQPILENCIAHGYRAAHIPLHIHIRAEYAEDNILITVEDDGEGIEPEKLAAIQQSLRGLEVSADRHFGIGNVNARLALYRQNRESCIDIRSKPGQGTAVILCIEQIIDL